MRIYPWMHTRNRDFFAKSGHFFLFAVQLEVLYGQYNGAKGEVVIPVNSVSTQ